MGVEGVSEVASIGGFIPSYEVKVSNDDLVRYNLDIKDIYKALKQNNNDEGGGIIIKNGFEWIIQAKGYQKDIKSIKMCALSTKSENK